MTRKFLSLPIGFSVLGSVCAALIPYESGHAQSKAWPTPAQRQLVEERKANFPFKTLVKDVDWYQPQEKVAGGRGGPFKKATSNSIGEAALRNAQNLIEATDSYAYLVWRDGKLEAEYYAPGFGHNSQYATASMAKTVLALSLGVALDQKLIQSVDDPVDRYLTQWAGHPRGAVTIRQYLQMTSTFETPSPADGNAEVYWQYALGDNIGEAVARWPETCKAGTEFCYANANSAVLGWVIEKASGKRFTNWLSQSIWQPIGAKDANFWMDRAGGSPRFSCCLHASAEDWLRVGLLILNEGKVGKRSVVSKDYMQQMLAPSIPNANYGFQIWRGSPYNPNRGYGKNVAVTIPAKQPFARDDVYYLDGSAGQRVYVVPSANMVIVRIGAARNDWDDSELPNILLNGIKN